MPNNFSFMKYAEKSGSGLVDVEVVVSKYGDYKNSDGTSSDSKSGDYSTIIY